MRSRGLPLWYFSVSRQASQSQVTMDPMYGACRASLVVRD
jgi:hypothetical protein